MLTVTRFVFVSALLVSVTAFAPPSTGVRNNQWKRSFSSAIEVSASRRDVVVETSQALSLLLGSLVVKADSVSAAEEGSSNNFTPGGTLVDRPVGVTVGNADASTSRAFDNGNVLFKQDHYFKFGVAPAWIEPESVEFPKTMPFTLSQQRYDALKKYGTRVQSGLQQLVAIRDIIADSTNNNNLADRISNDLKADAYQFRPMGLLANNFLASENTGTTNELLLSRWYINEMYLQITDIQLSKDSKDAMNHYENAKKAANSYIQLMNRVITPKVGDKLPFL